MEHHELHTAQERQLRLEAQALCQAQEQEQQAAQMTHEHKLAIQEFRRQTEEQPELHKLLWRRQLSQQSTYKAEIHELYTEMLNMREKSEMQSRLSAHMCKLEHTSPSRTLESEPENVLDTASPVEVQHGSFPAKWRHRTGQHRQVYSLHPFRCSLVQVLKLKNTVVKVHVVYLQLNGKSLC